MEVRMQDDQSYICIPVSISTHPNAAVLPPLLKVHPSSFLLGPFHCVWAVFFSTWPMFADPCFTCECRCQAHFNSPAFTRHFVLTSERGHVEGRKGGRFTGSSC